MSHITDFTKDSDQIVLDLVNHDNGTDFTLSVVEVGPVSPDGQNGRNSRVLLTAKEGTGYGGEVAIDYNRLNIADYAGVVHEGTIRFPLGEAVTTADFLEEINNLLGTNIKVEEMAPVSLTGWEGLPNEVRVYNFIVGSSGIGPTRSKVFVGLLPIEVKANDIPLDTVITNLILDGLNSPLYNDYIDIGPELATLIYPFKVLTTDTPATLKERLALRLGADLDGFALGEGADDVFTIPQNGSEDVTVKITSKRSQFFINGSYVGSVKLRYPEFVVNTVYPNHQDASGWVNDASYGWYNNSNNWDHWYAFQNIPTHFKSQLKKISAVFSSRINTPSGGAAQNTFVIWRGTGTPQGWWIGIDDNNDGVGMQVHSEGGFTRSTSDVLNRTLSLTFPEPTTLSSIFFRSNKLNTLPIAQRGFKNIKLEFFVSE